MAETDTKTSTCGNFGKITDGLSAKNARNELIDGNRLRSERFSHRPTTERRQPLIGN